MLITYRDEEGLVEVSVPADSVDIRIPQQEDQPELTVTVTNDTISVHQNGEFVFGEDYSSVLSIFEQENK